MFMQEKKNLDIRSILTGEFVSVELSYSVPPNLIAAFYHAFQQLRLKGAVMPSLHESELLTKAECQDYTDDYIYDEQQCGTYFSQRRWENFNLEDAAFFVGYLHVFNKEAQYSAMPFLFELVLRADRWVDAFSNLISRLRDDARNTEEELSNLLTSEVIRAIIEFLETLQPKAASFEKYEDVTVIGRAIKLWKNKIE